MDTKDSNLVINDRMTEIGLNCILVCCGCLLKYNVECREAFISKKPGQKPPLPEAIKKESPPTGQRGVVHQSEVMMCSLMTDVITEETNGMTLCGHFSEDIMLITIWVIVKTAREDISK